MARKPGVHTSKIYAFKSQVLGKYISVRAWGYDGNTDYKIRYLEVIDHPVSVARSEKAMRKIASLIPARLQEEIVEAEQNIDQARRSLDSILDLNRRVPPNGGYRVQPYHDALDRCIEIRDELMALLTHPIDIVMIEIRTETQETLV
jgi:hypothetical protein